MHTNRQRDVHGCELLSLLLQRVDPHLAFLSATRSCCSVPLKEALPSLIRVVISRPPPATPGGLSGWHLSTAGQSKQRCLLLNATAKWKMLPDKHDALLSNAPVNICVSTPLFLFHRHRSSAGSRPVSVLKLFRAFPMQKKGFLARKIVLKELQP